MSACVVEEGREEGGGACALEAGSSVDRDEMPERPRREVLLSARGRRACSEQGPHPSLNFHWNLDLLSCVKTRHIAPLGSEQQSPRLESQAHVSATDEQRARFDAAGRAGAALAAELASRTAVL
ncbi:hypothetical protein B5X24_HaOG201833 [Helicoverpa armigera]|nr:hypothetical protein B5X24_HaOG201833 [Helicoverpa armigera]